MSYVDIDPFTADDILEKFKIEEVSIYPEPPCENAIRFIFLLDR